MIVLEKAIQHDVEALEDTTFILTLITRNINIVGIRNKTKFLNSRNIKSETVSRV